MENINYYDRPELSYSKLKELDDGFENAKKKKYDTKALFFGRVTHEYILENVHSYVLEPEELMKGIKSRNVKAYQDWKKQQTKPVVTYDELQLLANMQKSVFGKQRFFNLYNSSSKEVEKEAFKEFMGIPFKAKADILDMKTRIGADLKTTQSIKNGSIERDIYNYKYHWQDYIYREMFDLKEFFFVFVEKVYPFKSQIVELSDEWRKIAKLEIESLINRWKLFQANMIDDKLEDVIINVPSWLEYKYKDII